MVAGVAITLSAACPSTPSIAAVTIVRPGARAVAKPVESSATTELSSTRHRAATSAMAWPRASRARARSGRRSSSRSVIPSAPSAPITSTAVTRCRTTIRERATRPPTATVIVVVPGARATTEPSLPTSATRGVLARPRRTGADEYRARFVGDRRGEVQRVADRGRRIDRRPYADPCNAKVADRLVRLRLAEDAEGVEEGEDRDTGRAGGDPGGNELARLTIPRRRGRVDGRRHEGALGGGTTVVVLRGASVGGSREAGGRGGVGPDACHERSPRRGGAGGDCGHRAPRYLPSWVQRWRQRHRTEDQRHRAGIRTSLGVFTAPPRSQPRPDASSCRRVDSGERCMRVLLVTRTSWNFGTYYVEEENDAS